MENVDPPIQPVAETKKSNKPNPRPENASLEDIEIMVRNCLTELAAGYAEGNYRSITLSTQPRYFDGGHCLIAITIRSSSYPTV